MNNAIISRHTIKKGSKDMSNYEYKYNAKKINYDMQYVKDHYDRIEIKLPKGYRDLIKKKADEAGVNQSVFLKQLIDNALNK